MTPEARLHCHQKTDKIKVHQKKTKDLRLHLGKPKRSRNN